MLLIAAPASAAEPTVHFATFQKGKPLVVEVSGVPATKLDLLRQQEKFDWPALLSVRVSESKTDLLGTYKVEGGVIRFESRFPPSPGVKFQARFDPAKLPGERPAAGKVITASAFLLRPPAVARTTVEHVYPSGTKLAENHLRFYLHFSAPMSRGDAYAHLKLLDDKGKVIAGPFLELGEELWDREGKRFTLLFHPGRVKRGLKPREELGPVLEEGKRYTLLIDEGWPDAEGNPLKAEVRKSFRVVAPDETQPDPKTWKLTPPKSDGPLVLRFPKPLDHGNLHSMIRVVDADGRPVAGAIQVSEGETRWQFISQKPWPPGRYRLQIDTALEDPAGNSIAKPFEIDLVQPRPIEKPKLMELDFEVK